MQAPRAAPSTGALYACARLRKCAWCYPPAQHRRAPALTRASPPPRCTTTPQEEAVARETAKFTHLTHDVEVQAAKAQAATARRQAAVYRRRCAALEEQAAKERRLVAQLEHDLQLEVPRSRQHRLLVAEVTGTTPGSHKRRGVGREAESGASGRPDPPTHLDTFVQDMLLAMRGREAILAKRRKQQEEKLARGAVDAPASMAKARAAAARDAELARISAFAVAVDYFQRNTRLSAALKEWHAYAKGLREALTRLEEDTKRRSNAPDHEPELDIGFDGVPLADAAAREAEEKQAAEEAAAAANDGDDGSKERGPDPEVSEWAVSRSSSRGSSVGTGHVGNGAREGAAATKVQAAMRGRRARQRVKRMRAESKSSDDDARQQAKAATRVQAAARGRRDRMRVKKLRAARHDDADANNDAGAQHAAAARVQAVARGRRDRRRVNRMRASNVATPGDPAHEQAAVKLQAVARGRRDRRRVKRVRARNAATPGSDPDQEQAAVKLQAVARGRRDRQRVKRMQEQPDEAAGDEAATSEQELAAVKLQAAARGRMARRQVTSTHAEASQRAASAMSGEAKAEAEADAAGTVVDAGDKAPAGSDGDDDYGSDTFEDEGAPAASPQARTGDAAGAQDEPYFSGGEDNGGGDAGGNPSVEATQQDRVPLIALSSFRAARHSPAPTPRVGEDGYGDGSETAHLYETVDGRGLWTGIVCVGTDGRVKVGAPRRMRIQMTRFKQAGGRNGEEVVVEAYDPNTVQSYGSARVTDADVAQGIERMQQLGQADDAPELLRTTTGVPPLAIRLLRLLVVVDDFRAESLDYDVSWQLPLTEVDRSGYDEVAGGIAAGGVVRRPEVADE